MLASFPGCSQAHLALVHERPLVMKFMQRVVVPPDCPGLLTRICEGGGTLTPSAICIRPLVLSEPLGFGLDFSESTSSKNSFILVNFTK